MTTKFTLLIALIVCATLSGCQTGGSTARSDATPSAGGSTAIPPGMNASGEVIDASKVQSGSGKKVKGIGDWEGEITGTPVANGKFAQLQIGMGARQAVDICGPPTDQGAYITGKAFIPFYFGSDRTRFELIYKGQGRLIFAGGGGYAGDWSGYSGGNLIWIINSASEPGYR
jgi:hypothetical protein